MEVLDAPDVDDPAEPLAFPAIFAELAAEVPAEPLAFPAT